MQSLDKQYFIDQIKNGKVSHGVKEHGFKMISDAYHRTTKPENITLEVSSFSVDVMADCIKSVRHYNR